ncbi:MAG TPA: serine O-acetyltransferase EpsC [Flavitalea sp.]|nr:serine O-acetyltransferase EpsC [Flavitalea sp.]
MSSNAFIKQIFDRQKQVLSAFPDKESSDDFIDKLFSFLFIPASSRNQPLNEVEKEFDSLKSYLSTLVYDVNHNGNETQQITEQFFKVLPDVYNALLKDASSIAKHDPAATSADEVVVAYPGFYAIAVYRLSHELYKLKVKTLPRLFTEYAHSKTGIDIHPGASIGEGFFIDHGTGIVIGETAVIGNDVKIYQGVTIGALLESKLTQKSKRHPTIQDDVIIYAGATILGGNTVIGTGSTIGGNVWLTSSVPSNSFVYQKNEVGVL